jgi:hypothetical protein
VPFNEDIDFLDRSIRRLQVEWDKFFSGLERKPPYDLRDRVEAVVKRYAHADIRNTGERYHYQSLVARYNIWSELWNKRLRALEEGRVAGLHGTHAQARRAARAAAAAAEAAASQTATAPAEVRVSDPAGDEEALRALFDRFVQARQAVGETGAVRFESFRKLLTQQAQRMRAERGAQAVDFRLETRDGKVSLKARVIR